MSFDLTGLPPAATDLALPVDRAVDRCLASPRFGERWARHWMDVARYAGTGFLGRAFLVSFGYRDWLIDAFNQDVPYDRFIALQLAADQMPGVNPRDHEGPERQFLAVMLRTLPPGVLAYQSYCAIRGALSGMAGLAEAFLGE